MASTRRLGIVYTLLSTKFSTRLLLKMPSMHNENFLSCTSLYSSGNWAEREIYEFFGLLFVLNKDLRHLLLDYGFIGFPLLKDFPLSGYVEVFL